MNYQVLGVCGGNGVILHPFKKMLLGNIEPRSLFVTPDDIQWGLNFKVAIDKTFNVSYSPSLIDVIIGAPDCGHSSVLAYSRAKKLSDPRDNESLTLYFKSIKRYQPKFFLMENLPKMLEIYDGAFEVEGYNLLYFTESVSKWGNSQFSRIRLVIVGIRKDLPTSLKNYFKLPNTEEFVYKTSGELIKGLEELNPSTCNMREDPDEYLSLYYKDLRKITVAEARKLWVNEFRHETKWPVNQGNLKYQPGIYRNFANKYPLTARKQNRQFNHNGFVLTPRELARIQNIPDHFRIWYDPYNKKYSLNKARITVTKTPPYDIGLWFYNCLSKINV